jgi:hypothetical protein
MGYKKKRDLAVFSVYSAIPACGKFIFALLIQYTLKEKNEINSYLDFIELNFNDRSSPK